MCVCVCGCIYVHVCEHACKKTRMCDNRAFACAVAGMHICEHVCVCVCARVVFVRGAASVSDRRAEVMLRLG